MLMFASIAMADKHSQNPTDYRIIALNDCEVVSDTPMTQQQLDAYLPLLKAEKLIEKLGIPMHDMEAKLKEYTDKIEEVTELAVQESGDSIHINKAYLSQQKELAEKIESIVSFHQKDIDAIEQQGTYIGKTATAFEHTIKADLEGIDYDNVRIIKPNDNSHYDYCD